MPLEPSRPLQYLHSLTRSVPVETSSVLKIEEDAPHLALLVVPQDKDTFAAVEVALVGSVQEEKKKKVCCHQAFYSSVPFASPVREETPNSKDEVPLSHRTKHRHDPAPTDGNPSRVGLCLKRPAGKAKTPPGDLSRSPQFMIDLERTPSPSLVDQEVAPPPPPPLQTPPTIPLPPVEDSPAVGGDPSLACP